MQTPVIFLVFNRPELTARVFARIREARPAKLLVVCDGPRPHQPADVAKVAGVHRIIESVDWPCEVMRNFAEKNMGCRLRVASGLNWAFSQVPEAIVLEDDCLPEPSFFSFCEDLLHRYRDDERIMHIAGTNLSAPYVSRSSSYWFSHNSPIWGWASWSRAWRHYDLEMSSWNERLDRVRSSFATTWEAQYWVPILHHAHAEHEKANTWDFSWTYACRSLHGLSIIPQNNLITNLGFGGEASHTTEGNSRLQVPSAPVGPMRHPPEVKWDRFGDEILTRTYAGKDVGFFGRLSARIRVSRQPLPPTSFSKPALDAPAKC